MQQLSSQKVTATATISEKETKSRVIIVPPKEQENAALEAVTARAVINRPFHLSMCVNNLETTRNFYTNILGIEERRATTSSVHFDFFGCQLTFHEVPGYTAKTIQRQVDAEDVPVPHFGAAVTVEEFEATKERLIAHGIEFIKKPRLRFVGKHHEQHVMFLEDPSGHGIEIKSFTRVPVGHWA